MPETISVDDVIVNGEPTIAPDTEGGGTGTAYTTDDAASTTINDTDYVPLSDANGNRKKSLWSNIVDKLKAIFLTNFVGTTAQWNALTREQKAQYKTADFTDDSTPSPIDANPTQGSGNAVSSGGVYSALSNLKSYTFLGEAKTPTTANTAVTITLSENINNFVFIYINYMYDWGATHPMVFPTGAILGVPFYPTAGGNGHIRYDVSATSIKVTTGAYDLGSTNASSNDIIRVYGIMRK